MLTKRAGTSTFGEDSQEVRCVDRRCVVFYTRNLWQLRLLSAALCCLVKARSSSPFYLMDRCLSFPYPPPLCKTTQISRAGLTTATAFWQEDHKFFSVTVSKDCWMPPSYHVLCLPQFFLGADGGVWYTYTQLLRLDSHRDLPYIKTM